MSVSTALIACANGLGHVRRVLLIASELNEIGVGSVPTGSELSEIGVGSVPTGSELSEIGVGSVPTGSD